MKKISTVIIVYGEQWQVPRGFGTQYTRIAKEWHPAKMKRPGELLAGLSDLLLLIGYEVKPAVIAEWPLLKRVEAEIYAGNVHLRASDNIMRAHPKPKWLPEPWKGASEGAGVFESPGGTPILE